MAIDLLRDAAPALLDAPPADLAAALRGVEAWTSALAESVDYVFRHQVVRLVQRRAGPDELTEWVDVIRRAVPPSRREALDALGTPWSARWRAFASVLESRLASLRAQDPAAVLERAHVQKLLDAVLAEPGVSQQALGDTAGLNKANLTRVLNLMEANDLVERRASGRENRVFPGPSAPRKAEVPPVAKAARPARRASDIFAGP